MGRFIPEDIPSDGQDLIIETINLMNIGWKADTCKLQKTHNKHFCEKPTILAQTSALNQ